MRLKQYLFQPGISVSVGVILSVICGVGINYFHEMKLEMEKSIFELTLRKDYQESLDDRIILIKHNLDNISNTNEIAQKADLSNINFSDIDEKELKKRIALYLENIENLEELLEELNLEKANNSIAVAKLRATANIAEQ